MTPAAVSLLLIHLRKGVLKKALKLEKDASRECDYPPHRWRLFPRRLFAPNPVRLQLDFTARQRQQLLDYTALLQRWNRVFNLTAVRDLEGIARLHLADCLAALPALQRLAPRRLLDVGSGGGLPGIVFAIGLPERKFI
jgi:16S rRNA m(7)G-527 methyltransferase (EC 2.1.1.-)